MQFLDLIGGGWAYLASKAGEVLHVASLLRERRDEKSKARSEIAKSYNEAWAEVRSTPGWEGINDRNRDLAHSPRTEVETRCVRRILFHFARALKEHRSGRYELPKGLDADVRNFFSYPVRMDAWRELKQYHDPEVVAFIDRVLSGCD